MKRINLLICLFVLFTTVSYSQTPSLPKQTLPAAANVGSLLTQFTDGLNPSSFTDAWQGEKTGWLGKAQKATDALSIASTVSSLAGFIKPDMFKQGSGVQSIMQLAGKVKTMTQAASLLKSFESGLKPDAFVSGWSKQRTGWISALNLLK